MLLICSNMYGNQKVKHLLGIKLELNVWSGLFFGYYEGDNMSKWSRTWRWLLKDFIPTILSIEKRREERDLESGLEGECKDMWGAYYCPQKLSSEHYVHMREH